jgi:hypothetical protein
MADGGDPPQLRAGGSQMSACNAARGIIVIIRRTY